MRRLGAAALAAAAGGLLACGSMRERPRPEPPAPALQIWAPPIVRWPPGAGRAVEFAIENGTPRTLEVALPDPAAAQVAIFPAVGEAQACGVAPAEPPAEPSAAGTVRLAPGDHLPVRVDLEDACASLPAGEYRYELSYRAARKGGGTLSLPTRYGTLLVAEGEAAGRRPPGPAPRRPAGRAP